MFKRFAASLALSLAMVVFGAPTLQAQTIHCTGCTYDGAFISADGDVTYYFTCDSCHPHP